MGSFATSWLGSVHARVRQAATRFLGEEPTTRARVMLPPGLARGEVGRVCGPPASGKTTRALRWVAQVTQAGGTAAFVDADRTLTAPLAVTLGVVVRRCAVVRAPDGETAFRIACSLAARGAVDLIVVDTLDALLPRAEANHRVGEVPATAWRRMASRGLHQLSAAARRGAVCVMLIDHEDRATERMLAGFVDEDKVVRTSMRGPDDR